MEHRDKGRYSACAFSLHTSESLTFMVKTLTKILVF
jgi:hypothetical protein